MAKNQRWRQIRKSNRTWGSPWLPTVAGVFSGLFLALALTSVEDTARGLATFDRGSSLTFAWAFLFGLLATALPVATIQKAAGLAVREVRALINIRPHMGTRLLGHDPWAMDALFAEQLLALIDEGHEHVVELGSGHSTVLIAERLEERGQGHVVAVDHLEEFAERTRGWIRDRGLEHRATVVHAPVVERDVEGRSSRWYAADALDNALPERIDLLVVDGPPDKLGRNVRWPAIPLLTPRLAPRAAILLDDGDRRQERRAAHDWHARLGGRIRYLPGGYLPGSEGAWLLRKSA